MKLSVVTTLYQSSLYLDEFYERISKEAKKITDDYEIIFVDDGSLDDSLQKAIALYEKDSKVKVIELSRNFGHHKAIMTGLSHAKGEFIFLIDVDLEEEPELLGTFWEVLQKSEDVDVVYGVQESRKGGWFERWSGGLFWKIINFLSTINIPHNMITARLTTKQYNKELLRYKESELFIGGIFVDTGFNQKSIKVQKSSTSTTTYTTRKKISLLLVYIFNIGLLITFISFLFILKLIFNKIVFWWINYFITRYYWYIFIKNIYRS